MIGGPGDDTYYVDNQYDSIVENPGEGIDTVYATVDFVLENNVDVLFLVEGASAAINAAGNGIQNFLYGNSLNNTLTGLGGADVLVGGAGNDVLDGGTGDDAMFGGIGNDTYYVDSEADAVFENAAEGTDTVFSTVNWTLGANFETLFLVEGAAGAINGNGNGVQNLLYGNSLNNTLSGFGGGDVLIGGDGNDVLDGGTGDDAMFGGKGDDTYYVDTEADAVIENANEGNDTVFSVVNWTLGANLESLFLVEGAPAAINGAGNAVQNFIYGNSLDNTLSGNGGDDVLVGGDGNDTLDGGTGNDAMFGGTGNDIYIVDSAVDAVIENAGEGTDTVKSSVDYTLGTNLENLTLLTGATNAVGNAGANVIIGNSSDNTINGAGGADAMSGGGGNDNFLISDSAFAGIDGGAGLLDRITLNTAGQTFDLSANAPKITNIEVISLAASAGAALHLAATDILQVNASGNYLYVVGGSDDQVALDGTWIVVTNSHSNPAVAPGVNFIQYHDAATDAELYISDTIALVGPFDPDNPPTIFLDGVPDGVDLPDGFGHLAAYTTGDAAGVAIGGADASIDDPDPVDIPPTISAHIVDLTAALTDAHSGALEFLNLTAAGQTIAANNGIAAAGLNSATLTLSGSASDAVYQDLLREIRYVNTDQSATLDTADRHVTVNAFDGIEHSNTAIATISLSNGGDPGGFSQDFLLV